MNASQSPLETLEELFGEEPFSPLEEELFKWFLFAHFGKGRDIKNLDNAAFEKFKNKLALLIDVLYQSNISENKI
jgi:hypothetical protein